jgi:hypothetical protein
VYGDGGVIPVLCDFWQADVAALVVALFRDALEGRLAVGRVAPRLLPPPRSVLDELEDLEAPARLKNAGTDMERVMLHVEEPMRLLSCQSARLRCEEEEAYHGSRATHLSGDLSS